MNQEELDYDKKLEELAKLNIFAPVPDDAENQDVNPFNK